MRTQIPVRSNIVQPPKPWSLVPCFSAIVAAFLLAPGSVHAATQQAVTQSATPQSTVHKTVHAHKRTSATQPAPQPQPVVEAPPAPKPPDWPVNDHPANASVVWNSQGLLIDAANSSLSQILKDVSTATGTKVDGLGADQRVFGTYGPGNARDVLAKLLEGSGYNVLMIGDQGQGTPRQVLLSTKGKGDATQAAKGGNQADANDENADADEQPQQPQPQPQPPPNLRNGFGPGAPPRTPQQIMQEMQQRQMQQQNGTPPQ